MYIGIDIGGTTGRVAAFESLEDPAIAASEHFPMAREYAQDFPRLLGAIQTLRGEQEVQGIGIGLAGTISADGSNAVRTSNLKGWEKQPIVSDLKSEFDCPVILANDTYVAALSESSAYEKDFWFVIWGTGIGGGYVTYHNNEAIVFASSLGHQVIDWDSKEPADACGRPGCLESTAGGASIERRYGHTAGALNDEEWTTVSEAVARGIFNVLKIRPVDTIVFGGGVATKHPDKLKGIKALLDEYFTRQDGPELTVAYYGENAGVTGAVMLLRGV